MVYDLEIIKAPRLHGPWLRALVAMVEKASPDSFLVRKLMHDAGMDGFRMAESHENPLFDCPIQTKNHKSPARSKTSNDLAAVLTQLVSTAQEGPTLTVAKLYRSYRDGATTPSNVAERFLEALTRSRQMDPPLCAFVSQDAEDLMEQAEASTLRFRQGNTIGPLDGIPVAVKDEMDLSGYPTMVGTSFMGRSPAQADAETCRRLRAQGALMLGKTNMHELGLGVTGINPHHGTPVNPWNIACVPGGSSSGSAVAVAAGLCPLAIGADGGGSIRIPSAFCGIVGLKPTFGRVSEQGAAPLDWSLVAQGPIGSTVADVAIGYSIMAGPDPRDPVTLDRPHPRLDIWERCDLSGITIGIFQPWFEDVEDGILEPCNHALEVLTSAGARIQRIEIPELNLLRVVHMVTIVSEMATSQLPHLWQHRRDYGLDVRLNLALAEKFKASDYIHAQRQRVRLGRNFSKMLETVDVLITPATACSAPELSPAAIGSGESDLPLLSKIMRFALAPNLFGLPAISVPVGHDQLGMPTGLQIIGRPWEEDLLLRMGYVLDDALSRQVPELYFDLLN